MLEPLALKFFWFLTIWNRQVKENINQLPNVNSERVAIFFDGVYILDTPKYKE
jgi:hypothetical protein